MASTPVALRNVQVHPLLSPQSVSQKRIPKRLSNGISLVQQSPNLPEVIGEIDSQTSRQRRHSRGLSKVLHLSKNAVATDLAEQRPKVNWTKDQLLQHYSQCMKLSQENKITHKNAFDLQLIEHMSEVIRQDGALNFRRAGGTIFAGAKIYASRVDAVHAEIYRVLTSLGGEKEETEDAQVDQENEPRVKRRKKNSKILETNESNLRVTLINSCWPSDSMSRSSTTAIDAASCDSLMINQTALDEHESTLLFDEEFPPREITEASFKETSTLLAELPEDCMKQCLDAQSISQTEYSSLKDLEFGLDMTDLPVELEHEAAEDAMIADNGDDNDDFATGGDEDFDPSSAEQPSVPEESVFDSQAPQTDQRELSPKNQQRRSIDVLDPTQLVSVEPQEYSYFKPNVLSVYNGPDHWLRHKSARATSSTSTRAEDPAAEPVSQPKKRKKDVKCKITLDLGGIPKLSRIQPQKISKAKLETLRANSQTNLLLESTEWHCQSLLASVQVKVVLRPLTIEMVRKAGVTVPQGEEVIVKFNYENGDFCPPTVDSDYDDGGQDDEMNPGFPNSLYNASETFMPNFADHDDNSNPSSVAGSTQSNYDALLEGDHLISQPRKIEKIDVRFASRAKRIDVRKLKSAMWSILDSSEKQTEDAGDAASSDNTEKTNDHSPEEETSADDVAKDKEDCHLFTELYKELPNKMSHLLSENLSIPLAFTCLLHLANEKQLKIEDTPSLNNLKISHGL